MTTEVIDKSEDVLNQTETEYKFDPHWKTEYKFDPHWKGDPAPLDYKGSAPFDRFGPNGHRYYNKGQHTNRFGHFCPEWDYMWICSDCKEFQACKCFEDCSHDDEVWFRDILPHMFEIEETCAANGYKFEWVVRLPSIELSGTVFKDSTVFHDNKKLDYYKQS